MASNGGDDTAGTSGEEEGELQTACDTSASPAPEAASDTACYFSLLLLGKTGVGKSATGNMILNLDKDHFSVDSTDTSVTSKYQIEYSRHKGRRTKVVDMPGLANSKNNKLDDLTEFEQQAATLVSETPDGYDAVLVVVHFGRQSMEDREIINCLKGIFGEQFFREYGILVVTYGDNFKRRQDKTQTFAGYCDAQTGLLKELWLECNKRAVLFDNVTNSDEEKDAQRKELFDMVEAMKRNSRYTSKIFAAAKKERDELIAVAEKLVLTDEIKSKLRLMIRDLKSVEFKTPQPQESIAELEGIHNRAETFIKEKKSKDSKLKKYKAVLAMAESIKKATERKLKIAKQIDNEPKMSADEKRELDSDKKINLQNEKRLENQYARLLQEDNETKFMIVAAVLAVLGFTIPVAAGVLGPMIIGGIAGFALKATLAVASAHGSGFAISAFILQSYPGLKKKQKETQESSPEGKQKKKCTIQ